MRGVSSSSETLPSGYYYYSEVSVYEDYEVTKGRVS